MLPVLFGYILRGSPPPSQVGGKNLFGNSSHVRGTTSFLALSVLQMTADLVCLSDEKF